MQKAKVLKKKMFSVLAGMELSDFVLIKNNFVWTVYLKNETGAIKIQNKDQILLLWQSLTAWPIWGYGRHNLFRLLKELR